LPNNKKSRTRRGGTILSGHAPAPIVAIARAAKFIPKSGLCSAT
jgi:hypothetical protein